MVLVVEGRVPDDDPHDLDRIQVGPRREAPVDADLDLDGPQRGDGLQGRELVRVLPAGGPRRRPEAIAQVEARELAHDAVDLEGQLPPPLLQLVVVGQAGLQALHRAAEPRVGQAPVRERGRELGLRGEGLDALDPRRRVGVELEGVPRDLAGVVAPNGAGGRVARVGEAGLPSLLALGVEGLEPGPRNEHLTADLQQPRHRAPAPVEGQGQVPDGAEVGGDLLPDHAVPAGDPTDQPAVLVDHGGADPVELGLAGPGQDLVGPEPEEALDLLHEVLHLLHGEQALDREHGDRVLDLVEPLALGEGRAHALGRALGHHELGVCGLERLQLPEQPVVLRIGHLGRAVHVVEAVVAQELGAQRGGALRDGSRERHGGRLRCGRSGVSRRARRSSGARARGRQPGNRL